MFFTLELPTTSNAVPSSTRSGAHQKYSLHATTAAVSSGSSDTGHHPQQLRARRSSKVGYGHARSNSSSVITQHGSTSVKTGEHLSNRSRAKFLTTTVVIPSEAQGSRKPVLSAVEGDLLLFFLAVIREAKNPRFASIPPRMRIEGSTNRCHPERVWRLMRHTQSKDLHFVKQQKD